MSDDWREQAACRDHPLELFFPNSAGDRWGPGYQKARLLCASCPVRDECLQDALGDSMVTRADGRGNDHGGAGGGFRAGLTARERARLRRKPRRKQNAA